MYCSYFNNIQLENTLLIFDSAPMHCSLEVLKYLCNKKINYVLIPKGLTPILQPLNVNINKPFKEAIKHKYESSVISFSNKNNIKIKREVLLKWINDCLYDSNIIKKEMIIKSFLVTGISNKLDGTQDDFFTEFNKIQDICMIKNDFSNSDKEDENNNIDANDSIDSSEKSSDLENENEKI